MNHVKMDNYSAIKLTLLAKRREEEFDRYPGRSPKLEKLMQAIEDQRNRMKNDDKEH